ncbi:MAG: DUF3160 domain-containing protein [Methanolobus sp.]|nr:DUF3160 domain-containing protein [Methanolobus sp.]
MKMKNILLSLGIIIFIFILFFLYVNYPETNEPSISHYNLPLASSSISNIDIFPEIVDLNEQSIRILENNGFVVVSNPFNSKEDSVIRTYSTIDNNGLPVFITTDSMLHMYHLQYVETLKTVEEEQLYRALWETDKKLLEYSIEDYESSSGLMKEAARKNVAYFSVALAMLEPNEEQIFRGNDYNNNNKDSDEVREHSTPIDKMHLFTTSQASNYSFEIPEFVAEDVEAELVKINDKQISMSAIFNYNEDYSQYIPRGHYVRSEHLINYFKAMTWHGRMKMLLKSDLIECDDPETEAKIQTLSAALISSHMANDDQLMTEWERINGVISFMVGTSADLGIYEYINALNASLDEGETLEDLDTNELKMELRAYRNEGLSGKLVKSASDIVPSESISSTAGFRLLGQCHVVDSFILQSLVYPEVPDRHMPTALDVMAVMGSERAYEHLASQGELTDSVYKERLSELKHEMNNYNASKWNDNLYLSWLNSLRYLLNDHDPRYPVFMQTEAWKDKELNTALFSWTQLKHDTMLYAKQSSTVTGMHEQEKRELLPGYVEPVPEFYRQLSTMTRNTSAHLDEMGCLDKYSKKRLDNLDHILGTLETISNKELNNEELSSEEYSFIANFDQKLRSTVIYSDYFLDPSIKKTTLVADVHTDYINGLVLEEGTGYVDIILVAYELPSGEIVLGAGPVIQHYEFTRPASGRLTDEEWRTMLETEPPERPNWSSSFSFLQ